MYTYEGPIAKTYGSTVIIIRLEVLSQQDAVVRDPNQTNCDILKHMICCKAVVSNAMSLIYNVFWDLIMLFLVSWMQCNQSIQARIIYLQSDFIISFCYQGWQQFKLIRMLSPLKSQQSLTNPTINNATQSKIYLSSTYQYPRHYNFLSTPSIEYKHNNELKESLNSFYFPVFDLSKTSMQEVREKNNNNNNQEETKSKLPKRISSLSQINGYNVNIDECSKPQPFMGAFMQTQKEFGFFDLNIKIPTLHELKPFSRILSESIVKELQQQQHKQTELKHKHQQQQKQKKKQEQQKQKKKQEKQKNKQSSQLLNSQASVISQQQQSNLYNLDLSLSNIDQQSQQPQQFTNLWDDYESKSAYLQASHKRYVNEQMWEKNTQDKQYFNHGYQFHLSRCSEFINSLEGRSLLTEKTQYYSEEEVSSGIVKMLLGIQSELFKLEYHTLTWSVNSHLSIKLEHILKNSLENYLEDILIISNYKSRLQTCLAFVKNESYRRILQQIAIQTKQFLLILEQIALQLLKNKQSFMSSIICLSQLKPVVTLIYQLLINQTWVKTENKSYIDFDISFLNSEAVIFRQIVRMSNNNDMLFGNSYELCLKMLRAAFKPITFTLNRIVFEQITEISNRDDTYLRFYFENLKDLLSYLGKRIDLIKQQSNELYMICRVKQKIQIIVETNQLEQYIKRWDNLFCNKRKMIQSIQNREKKRRKQIKQKEQQLKIKQIYQLKKRLLKSIEQTKQRKSEIYLQGIKQIEKLKKDIAEREERRRLNYLIEKQQEKGFLLDAELKEKRNLIHQKEELLQKAERQGLELIQKIILENEQKQKNKEQIKNKDEETKIQMIKTGSTKNEMVRSESLNQKSKVSSKIVEHSKSQVGLKTQISLDQSKQYSKQQIKKQQMAFEESSNNIKKLNKISSISITNQPKPQQDSQLQPQPQQQQPNQQPLSSDVHVSTNTVLQLCIDTIIRKQMQITNMAMSYLVYDKYQLFSIMQFMRKIFLNGNGQGLTNMIHLSINNESKINLNYFRDCLLFDIGDQFLREMEPQFYEVHALVARDGSKTMTTSSINIFQESLDVFIGFQFSRLPVILEPYFSYIHLSKYMQIFSYILKINHCLQLTSSCLLLLNQCSPPQKQKKPSSDPLLQKLYLTRHSIHIFLNTLQSYLFHRIIEKQLKTLRTKLKNKDVNELAIVHLNMLDSIIRKGLIQNSFNDISKKIRGLLMEIRKFKNIVDSFCANDIHSYVKPEIQSQVQNMFRVFREQQIFLESLFYHP